MVSVTRRYNYRAYPTRTQEHALAKLFGCCRVVFNDYLAFRLRDRELGIPHSERLVFSAVVTKSKQLPHRAFLADVSSTALQQSVRDAGRAYSNFFASLSGSRKGRQVGAPRFKTRRGSQSARFTRGSFKIHQISGTKARVFLARIGWITIRLSRPLPSEPSSVTITKKPSGRYQVSFVVQVQTPEPLPEADTVAGVDLGLLSFAAVASSSGGRYLIENPRWARAAHRKLLKAQRRLSRTRKGSKGREKARIRVATCHQKIVDARADFHHKLALQLVRENQTLCIEDLNVAGLSKTRLARSIADVGWAAFNRILTDKASLHGRQVVRIDRFAPTTRTCSVCGTYGDRKALSVRVWECESCGTVLDRDFNAAVNILVAAGHAETLNASGGNIRRQLAAAEPNEAGTLSVHLYAA